MGHNESLVRSGERVRELGEVFTPSSVVEAMLDLLPDETWNAHPSPTFLEPACGHGNFLVAVFDRKAEKVADEWRAGALPAGDDRGALLFHLLEALSSVYGVDIAQENIEGAIPDHPLGARERMVRHFNWWAKETLGRRLPERDSALRSAYWIAMRNVQVGNMLPLDSTGRPTGTPPTLQILDYVWSPAERTVGVSVATLADVRGPQAAGATGQLSLFTPPEPELAWEGEAACLHAAPVPPTDADVDFRALSLGASPDD